MRRSHTATFLAVLMLAVALPAAATSAPDPFVGDATTKITPDALEAEDRFGRALAVDGDRLVLGSPLSDGEDGLVFVYTREATGLAHEATISTDGITIDEPVEDAELGAAVAIDGDRLVVGAPGVDTAGAFEAGAAFVFENGDDGWTQTAAIPAPDPQGLDAFGLAVAIDGDHVAVSEPEDAISDEYASNGAVHVYEAVAEGWTHDAELVPPADDDRERLGVSLVFEDGTLAAGAPQDETPTGNGAIYTYEDTDGWTQTDRLVAPDDAEAEQLGRDIALEGDTLVAGAPGPQASICCPSQPVPEGQAHAFAHDGSGWTHDTELDPVTSARGHGVGMSVALDGDTAFVGAPSAPADSVYGTVSVFTSTGDGWEEAGRIASSDPASGDRFAKAMVADADQVLVGAPGDDEAGHNAGAAYLVSDLVPDPTGE